MTSPNCVPVILAGGLGTRIRHLLPDRPKPMAEVASKPFLSWTLNLLAQQGFTHAVISTGYKGDFIESFYRNNPINGIEITCIHEPSPLGTAGGFLHSTEYSKLNPNSWLVLNGDSIALTNFQDFINKIESLNAPTGIMGLHMDDASRYGSLIYSAENDLLEFAEKKPGSATINAGVYYFTNPTLKLFPNISPLSFETDVFPTLLKNNLPIKVVQTNAPFIDIGTPETLKASSLFIANNLL